MAQHELAAVYAEFIPKDRFFDYDDFGCVVIGDEVRYKFDDLNEYHPDLIALNILPIGTQSPPDEDSSILFYLFNTGEFEDTCNEETAIKLAVIARQLREGENACVRFVVILDCEAKQEYEEYYPVASTSFKVNLVRYCDIRSLEWKEV